jgi:hypothetical protein
LHFKFETAEKFGSLPDAAIKALEKLAPETRADAVALFYDTDGVLVDIVPYSKADATKVISDVQKRLEDKAIKEKKLTPKPPYKLESKPVDDPRREDKNPNNTLSNTLSDARDRGVRITDGTREGIVELGRMTDGVGNPVGETGVGVSVGGTGGCSKNVKGCKLR